MDVRDEIAAQIDKLPAELQVQVLHFLASLAPSAPKGETGSAFRAISGSLDPLSANEIARAIEEGCEQVNAGEW